MIAHSQSLFWILRKIKHKYIADLNHQILINCMIVGYKYLRVNPEPDADNSCKENGMIMYIDCMIYKLSSSHSLLSDQFVNDNVRYYL